VHCGRMCCVFSLFDSMELVACNIQSVITFRNIKSAVDSFDCYCYETGKCRKEGMEIARFTFISTESLTAFC
jgi:hypothetical protein